MRIMVYDNNELVSVETDTIQTDFKKNCIYFRTWSEQGCDIYKIVFEKGYPTDLCEFMHIITREGWWDFTLSKQWEHIKLYISHTNSFGKFDKWIEILGKEVDEQNKSRNRDV